MESIVIAKKNVAYAAKIGGGVITSINDVNFLDDGAIAVFTDKSELVTGANLGTILADKKGVFFAVGSGSSVTGAYVTVSTRRLTANYTKKGYVAPVKEVRFIGYDGTIGALNLPTLTPGLEAFIKIVDRTSGLRQMIGVYKNEIKNYSYTVKTGDTDTIIVNNLVAAINNDLTSIVTAAVIGITPNLGISITPKDFGTNVSIVMDGVLTNATREEGGVGNSTALVVGEGTSAQVLAQEDLISSLRGNTNKIMQSGLWYSVPSSVVTGSTYDQYVISWAQKIDRLTGSQFTTGQRIFIAIPNGAASQTTFEAIMAQVYGVAEDEETGI